MKNIIICKTCKASNPFYQLVCINCKAYLRERVYNIDLWNTLTNLVENPKNAFKKIIYSEKKNFVLAGILFISLKMYIDSIFFFLIGTNKEILNFNVITNYLIVFLSLIIVISILALIIKTTNMFLSNPTRMKDIFSILVYAMLPNVLGLVILFPIEIVFFGGYIFSINPSPFIINKTAFIIFIILETTLIIWSMVLGVIGVYTLTNNLIYSLTFGSLAMITLYVWFYFQSFYLFNK